MQLLPPALFQFSTDIGDCSSSILGKGKVISKTQKLVVV
jgi:hypothetical protein